MEAVTAASVSTPSGGELQHGSGASKLEYSIKFLCSGFNNVCIQDLSRREKGTMGQTARLSHVIVHSKLAQCPVQDATAPCRHSCDMIIAPLFVGSDTEGSPYVEEADHGI